jgi:type I restriction enzyme M protein
MTTAEHDGSVGNNNLIRVVIDDPALRSYVYQFLRSDLGQTLLLRNVYGTNQDHIEPDDVKDMPIPLPRDRRQLDAIADRVQQVVRLREETAMLDRAATSELDTLVSAAFSQSGIEMPIIVSGANIDED